MGGQGQCIYRVELKIIFRIIVCWIPAVPIEGLELSVYGHVSGFGRAATPLKIDLARTYGRAPAFLKMALAQTYL